MRKTSFLEVGLINVKKSKIKTKRKICLPSY